LVLVASVVSKHREDRGISPVRISEIFRVWLECHARVGSWDKDVEDTETIAYV
jgi:hypothetical protein